MSKKAEQLLLHLNFDEKDIKAIMSDDPNVDAAHYAQVFIGGQFELFRNNKDFGGKIKNEVRNEEKSKYKKSLCKEFGLNIEDEFKDLPELLLEAKKSHEKSVSEKYANLTDTEAKVELKNMKVNFAKLEDEIKQLKDVEIPLREQTAKNQIKEFKLKEKVKKQLLKGVEFNGFTAEAFEEKFFDAYYTKITDNYDLKKGSEGNIELWDKSGDGQVYEGSKLITPKIVFLQELEKDGLLKQGVSTNTNNPPANTTTTTTPTNKTTVVVETKKATNMLAPTGSDNPMMQQIEAAKAAKKNK